MIFFNNPLLTKGQIVRYFGEEKLLASVPDKSHYQPMHFMVFYMMSATTQIVFRGTKILKGNLLERSQGVLKNIKESLSNSVLNIYNITFVLFLAMGLAFFWLFKFVFNLEDEHMHARMYIWGCKLLGFMFQAYPFCTNKILR